MGRFCLSPSVILRRGLFMADIMTALTDLAVSAFRSKVEDNGPARSFAPSLITADPVL